MKGEGKADVLINGELLSLVRCGLVGLRLGKALLGMKDTLSDTFGEGLDISSTGNTGEGVAIVGKLLLRLKE